VLESLAAESVPVVSAELEQAANANIAQAATAKVNFFILFVFLLCDAKI